MNLEGAGTLGVPLAGDVCSAMPSAEVECSARLAGSDVKCSAELNNNFFCKILLFSSNG